MPKILEMMTINDDIIMIIIIVVTSLMVHMMWMGFALGGAGDVFRRSALRYRMLSYQYLLLIGSTGP